MDRCFYCKGTLEKRTVNFDFRWGDNLVLLEKVPALVCQQCDEKYFSKAEISCTSEVQERGTRFNEER
ncbi:MAG: YgiT-type zinc finger protein [Thermodesulfovibrionales bacterium]|nr:YgiT-type zinc finger protein [Nitrospinota bacterium]MCG2708749.1 YgiT-type zinc finger protein [Thermodesulfovibrionales bacterium]